MSLWPSAIRSRVAETDRWIPVTLSSTMPFSFWNRLGCFLWIQWVRSPPSSKIWQAHAYVILGLNSISPQSRHLWFWYHVGVPDLSAHTFLNAPPEVGLWLSPPRKHHSAWSAKRLRGDEKPSVRGRTCACCTAIPPSARAAATVSWVEKMLQAAQRHWAPNTDKVSINTCRRSRQWLSHSPCVCVCVCVSYWLPSVRWCACSPSLWLQLEVSPLLLFSSGTSGLPCLQTPQPVSPHTFIHSPHSDFLPAPSTSLCNFYFPASEMSLFDVLDAEVGEARGGLLLLFPGRGLTVWAVAARWKREMIVGEFSAISWRDSWLVTNEPALLTRPFSFRVSCKTFEVCTSDWHVWTA